MNEITILFILFVIYIFFKIFFKFVSKIAQMQGYTPSHPSKSKDYGIVSESKTKGAGIETNLDHRATIHHSKSPQNLFEIFKEIHDELKHMDEPGKITPARSYPINLKAHTVAEPEPQRPKRVHTTHHPPARSKDFTREGSLSIDHILPFGNMSDLQKGIILSEILGPPISRRQPLKPPFSKV